MTNSQQNQGGVVRLTPSTMSPASARTRRSCTAADALSKENTAAFFRNCLQIRIFSESAGSEPVENPSEVLLIAMNLQTEKGCSVAPGRPRKP
jgi:hypothetical protein